MGANDAQYLALEVGISEPGPQCLIHYVEARLNSKTAVCLVAEAAFWVLSLGCSRSPGWRLGPPHSTEPGQRLCTLVIVSHACLVNAYMHACPDSPAPARTHHKEIIGTILFLSPPLAASCLSLVSPLIHCVF